jgi:hypothetical protein
MKKSKSSKKAKRQPLRKASPRRVSAASAVRRAGPTKNATAAGKIDFAADGMIEGIDGEPWVKLQTEKDLANWSKNDEIRYNQINRQAGKYLFFRKIFDFLNENEIRGDYLEFGCHRCRTFRMVLTEARRHNLSDMKFWAFDSFEGLPEPTTETSVSKWTSGALTTSEAAFHNIVREHGIYVDNFHTVKGFYDSSLTDERQRDMLNRGTKAALITVDCDLYESAVPVFNFIEPLLQEGTAIYMDDLLVGNKGNPNRGVARAFLEFQQRSRWQFIPHLEVGWWGRSYITVDNNAGAGVGI